MVGDEKAVDAEVTPMEIRKLLCSKTRISPRWAIFPLAELPIALTFYVKKGLFVSQAFVCAVTTGLASPNSRRVMGHSELIHTPD